MVFLRTPGAADTVTLRRSDSSDRPGDGGGIGHFGFRLFDEKDLDQAVEEVERAGGRLIRRGEHPDGQPFAYVADPDGYVIEPVKGSGSRRRGAWQVLATDTRAGRVDFVARLPQAHGRHRAHSL